MLEGPLGAAGNKNGGRARERDPPEQKRKTWDKFRNARLGEPLCSVCGMGKQCTHYVGITSAVQEPRGTMAQPSNRGPGVATQSATRACCVQSNGRCEQPDSMQLCDPN